MSITRNWTGLGYNGDINDPDNWTSSQDINGNICYYGDTWGDTLVIGNYSGSHADNYLNTNIYGQLSVPAKKFIVKKEFKGNIGYLGSPIIINLTGTYSPPSAEYITNCNGSILQINDIKTFIENSEESFNYWQSNDFDFVINSIGSWWNALDEDNQINSVFKYYLSYVDIDIGNPFFDGVPDSGFSGGSTVLPSSSGSSGGSTVMPSSSSTSSNPTNLDRVIYIKVLDAVGNGYWNCSNRVIKSLNFVSVKGLGRGTLDSGQSWNTNFNLEGDIFYLYTPKYAGYLNANNCEIFHINQSTTSSSAQWHPTQSDYTAYFIFNLRGSAFSTQPVSDSDPYDPYGTGCVLNQIIESNNELTSSGYSVGSILGTNKTNVLLVNYVPNQRAYAKLCGHMGSVELNGYNQSIQIGDSVINGLLGAENQIRVDSLVLNSQDYDYNSEEVVAPWETGLITCMIKTKSTIGICNLQKGLLWDYLYGGAPSIGITKEYETTIDSLEMSGGALNIQNDWIYPTGINATKLIFSDAIQEENGIKLMKYIGLSNQITGNGQYWLIGDNRPQFDAWTNYHRGYLPLA
jgi:hypothetical protein